MQWVWSLPEWPRFRYDPEPLAAVELEFREKNAWAAGALSGVSQSLGLAAEMLSEDTADSSLIEGVQLDRASVQSSIRRGLGLASSERARPAEAGVAEMTLSVFQGFAEPLTNRKLWEWHTRLMAPFLPAETLGVYRSLADPMQIVSGALSNQKVHYEAVPGPRVAAEMDAFVAWFNGGRNLGALERAALCHVWFECVHPFEDGNGRIGRALCELSLSQSLGRPSLAMLGSHLAEVRSEYYVRLGACGRTLDVQSWFEWFASACSAAQDRTNGRIRFHLQKTRLFDRASGQVSPRQEQVLARILRDGPKGFKGGLSTGNYQKLTGVSAATAHRDLAQMVELGLLRKTGQLKGTRYWPELEGDAI